MIKFIIYNQNACKYKNLSLKDTDLPSSITLNSLWMGTDSYPTNCRLTIKTVQRD